MSHFLVGYVYRVSFFGGRTSRPLLVAYCLSSCGCCVSGSVDGAVGGGGWLLVAGWDGSGGVVGMGTGLVEFSGSLCVLSGIDAF